ncbi:MAG: hypothetical protein ISS45_02685 [Candidatus Omnitrophica bacterium]|nr:hypothetical protein [Candidatus Omnitrophota bacterium]
MLKVSRKLLISPKVLWPSIIILLIICISLQMLKEEEKALRMYAQKRLTETREEKEIIEKTLSETIKIKKITEEELTNEREKSIALKKEIEEQAHQIKLILNKLGKETTTRRQVEVQFIAAMEEKRILEAKLKELTDRPKAVELGKVVVNPVHKSAGKVLAVNKEYAFIVVDLGRANNLRPGDILSLYRDDKFIGKVEVESVEEKFCAAAILPDWQDVEFKENDVVKKH